VSARVAGEDGVIETVHEAEMLDPDSAQAPADVTVTVPVGIVAPEVDVSVTVMAHVESCPIVAEAQRIDVLVGFFPIVIVADPVLDP
jgi:hypothetical protein